MKLILPAVLAVLFSVVCVAQWRENGEKVADTAWSKQKDQFGAMLLLSDKPEEFLKAWEQPTDGVPIQTTDTISRENPIVAFVIFSGCLADKSGLCDASVDFTVVKPDGTVWASYEDKDLWKKKPAVDQSNLQLSKDYVGVIVEADDPLGRYAFRVVVHDRNAAISFELVQEFTAVE